MSIINDSIQNIVTLPRYAKRILIIFFDLSLCILCTWLAFFLRLEELIIINSKTVYPFIFSIILALPIFWLLGLYKTIIRFAGLSIIISIIIATFIYTLLYFSIIGVYGIPGTPRSIGIIQPLLLFFGVISSRLIIKYIVLKSNITRIKPNYKKNILIYGAGSAGRQLLNSLENNFEMEVIGFLDDDRQLQYQSMLGKRIYSPSHIKQIIQSKKIDIILLALPSISRAKRDKIIDNINKYSIIVKTLPSIQDIVDGKISVSDIRDLTIEDLLSREQVKPDQELLIKNIRSKVVLVTGAGGSIGSELSRQILKLNPTKLLLLELNEFALYNIREELKYLNKETTVVPLLVNIQNLSRVTEVLKTFNVDTIYHAAAYKHVPLVEENICESVKNNVYGTYNIAKLAIEQKVSNFVLISSDKAVRSTNIMGATKRLSEICVQSIYDNYNDTETKFSIVRFGNVLQSSGSVIPKFKKQIKQGGPVTLTHPEVTRYFMTLTEASQLVIQAGAMSKNCEVFVLDMGKSVLIKDLVYKMIKLSGLTVRDSNNPDGDIKIEIIGLRPGEKLYEELLLGENPQKTSHEKIQKAQDPFLSFDKLKIELDKLSELLENNDIIKVKEMLSRIITSYKSNSKIVDHIYKEKLDIKSLNENKDQYH